MKILFILCVAVMSMYESVIDLLFELQETNQRLDSDLRVSIEKSDSESNEFLKGITAVEVDAFENIGAAKLKTKEIENDLQAAKYFIKNSNRNLKHDSEQLTQIKDKRCFENNSFISSLVALKESEETVDSLKQELESYFQTQNPVFLEKLFEVITSLNQNSNFLQLEYGIYTHSYEFSTEQRNSEDDLRTIDALKYANSKELENLDSDLNILLDQLSVYITQSVKALEEREIKIANDVVRWEGELQKESAQYLDQIERKNLQIKKIERDHQSVQELRGFNQELWKYAKYAREEIENNKETFKRFNDVEIARRKHTNEAIEEALYIFETQFPEYTAYIQSKRE